MIRLIARMGLALPIGLLLLLCGWATIDAQQPASLSMSVDRESVQIAEPFSVEIVGVAHAGDLLFFPAVNEKFGEFDVVDHVDQFDVPDIANPEQRKWVRRLTLETLETGLLEIPGIEVTCVGSDSARRTLQAEPKLISVLSVLENEVDTTQFSDIRDVVDVEPPPAVSYVWLGWTAGGTLGVAGIAGLFLAFTRRKQWMTPSAWALKKLGVDADVSVQEVERTLRVFVEKEFEFSATSNSNEQIRSELSQRSVSEQWCKRLSDVFDLAEQAKFAGLELDPKQQDAMRREAMAIVVELNALNQEVC